MVSIDDTRWTERRGPLRFQIALVACGILALELALIRWTSGQIRLFAYLNNLVLIGCFLGMGLGMVLGARRPGLVHGTLPALCILCLPFAFSWSLGWMQLRFPDPSIHLWGAEVAGAPAFQFIYAILVVLFLFCGLVAVFLFAGGALGHLLAQSSNLRSYSADLTGGLIGILAITLATALNAPPTVWFLLGCLPFLWLSRSVLSFLSLAGILALAHGSIAGAIFSPYNRIDIEPSEWGPMLSVNRDFHQYIHDFSDPEIARAGWHPKARFRKMYDLPFVLGDARERALIVGAGTGNDVQAALRNGFQKVYSVEIDRRILEMGRKLHPEKPYGDSRVVPVVNDARAFFEQYDGPPFDVICFGLVDSHSMFSAYSMLRLDNFVYTEEGIRAAWKHLAPNGCMTVNFSVFGGPWIAHRLYSTIAKGTGVFPIICEHRLHHGATYVVSPNPARLHLDRVPDFPWIQPNAIPQVSIRSTSDNWPFLYIRPGVFPWGYLTILGGVMIVALVGIRFSHGSEEKPVSLDPVLFFMGAAFMLIETRGITSLSLLFGSTWIVNASVMAGILLMALAANGLVQRGIVPSVNASFLLLLGTVFCLWVFDISSLNRLPLAARWMAGGFLHALPIGCAGLVISTLLARSSHLAGALASNILGSVLGGCLEYLSIYFGLHALVLMAGGLYAMAWWSYSRSRPLPS